MPPTSFVTNYEGGIGKMCERCGDTGRLPVPNYTHGFFDCTCKELPQERYRPFNPDDIDFPCSRDFRRFYELEGGRPDPGGTYPAEQPQPTEQVIVHRHSNMSKLEADLLQQTAGKLEHVAKTLKEHLTAKRQELGEY